MVASPQGRPAGNSAVLSPRPAVLPRSGRLEGDDVAVRVRAGLSLLGVSVMVGVVTAGLITVAIFMVGLVFRRALG